jgi:hypothetical protein
MIHDRLPPEYKAVSQMQRAWDTPKIAACPDSGCACYSIKSQYPQIVMSPLFRKRGHFSSLILKKRQRKPALITLNYPADAKLIAKEGEDVQA